MSACKTLVRVSLSHLEFKAEAYRFSTNFSSFFLPFSSPPPRPFFSSLKPGFRIVHYRAASRRCYSCINGAIALDSTDAPKPVRQNVFLAIPEDSSKDTVEELLSKSKHPHHDDDVSRFMKMERRVEVVPGSERWFPYLDNFKAGSDVYLSSAEVLEALDPYIMVARKDRFRDVVKNRSYSVCLVVEGLADFGNVSAAFRSADALGFQSVHVVSCDSSKRCNMA